jgi:hypothetical protein
MKLVYQVRNPNCAHIYRSSSRCFPNGILTLSLHAIWFHSRSPKETDCIFKHRSHSAVASEGIINRRLTQSGGVSVPYLNGVTDSRALCLTVKNLPPFTV